MKMIALRRRASAQSFPNPVQFLVVLDKALCVDYVKARLRRERAMFCRIT
jgi:hypothetical protein